MDKNYTDEIKICNLCGSIVWKEVSNKAIIISLNKKGITQKDDEEWIDDDNVYYYCNECDSDDLTTIDINDMEEKELKELANMTDEQRLEWIKKREVIDNLR
jgi:hypothetical protein